MWRTSVWGVEWWEDIPRRRARGCCLSCTCGQTGPAAPATLFISTRRPRSLGVSGTPVKGAHALVEALGPSCGEAGRCERLTECGASRTTAHGSSQLQAEEVTS